MGESPRIEELKRRVQVDPASIAFAALAEEYRRAGRFEEAIATCQAGLQRHPAYLSAHVTLGRALLELGRFDEARVELEHVLRAAPENLAAIRGLAEIHHRRGELPEALEQYRSALQVAKHDAQIEQAVEQISKQVAPAGSVAVSPPAAAPIAVSSQPAAPVAVSPPPVTPIAVSPPPAAAAIVASSPVTPSADPPREAAAHAVSPPASSAAPEVSAPEFEVAAETPPREPLKWPSPAAPAAAPVLEPVFEPPVPEPVDERLATDAIWDEAIESESAPVIEFEPFAGPSAEEADPEPDPALAALEELLAAILRAKDDLAARSNVLR